MNTHQQYAALIEKKAEEADRIFGTHLAGNVNCKFDARGGACAKASINRLTGVVTFHINPEALEQDWDDMVNDTIPHEVAHLVNFLRPSTGKNHNAGWKRTCRTLGGSGDRLALEGKYNLTPARVSTKHRYKLPSGAEHILGARRHSNLQKGKKTYKVTSTGEQITASMYVGPVNAPKLDVDKHSTSKPKPVRGGKRTKTSIVRDLVIKWMAEGLTAEQLLTDQDKINTVRVDAGYPHDSIAKSSLKHNIEKLLAEQK